MTNFSIVFHHLQSPLIHLLAEMHLSASTVTFMLPMKSWMQCLSLSMHETSEEHDFHRHAAIWWAKYTGPMQPWRSWYSYSTTCVTCYTAWSPLDNRSHCWHSLVLGLCCVCHSSTTNWTVASIWNWQELHMHQGEPCKMEAFFHSHLPKLLWWSTQQYIRVVISGERHCYQTLCCLH